LQIGADDESCGLRLQRKWENRMKIAATPQTVKWGFFDAATPPTAEVEPGVEIVVDTVSGEPWDLPDDPRFALLPEHQDILAKAERGPGPHLLTGPIAVKGAKPGAVLQVDILDIRPRQNWGWNLIHPLLGTLPEDFPQKLLRHLPIDLERQVAGMPWGGELALRPFFGVIGVAPPAAWGRVTTVQPRAHGGNMDNKELRPGTTVYFPVFNEGGLLSVGDGHGMQGDGEVCVTAVETALTGTFRLSVRNDMELARPRAEDAERYITMGFDEDLDDAVRQALRDMIRWVHEAHGLSREDAYMLCSLAADLRVTQTVNGNKGAHCVLAKAAIR
jgi:acetamidase/formamidase